MNFIALLVTVVSAFLITSVIGMWLIPFLRRLHFGQTILDIGPAWHKSKQGTPTMGGIMFIAGITIAILAGWLTLELSEQGVADASAAGSFYLWGGLLMALAFGLIGFLDDYISVVKKQNLGLKAGQKSLAQLLVAVVYLAAQQIFAPTTSFWLPFIGDLDIGIFYYPLMLFIIVGTVNAVNLTDGIDGLAAGVTLPVAVFFVAVGIARQDAGVMIFAAALAGGLAAFLIYNFNPAKVFMGDTGSLFLGGAVAGLAFACDMPLILLLVGLIYIIETLSVILQVTYFKASGGKRLFRMAPIHHHFEMCGWGEKKIVLTFSGLTALLCLLAYFVALGPVL